MNKKGIWAAGISIAIVAGLALILYLTRQPKLHGAVINPPLPAAEIQLTDSSGKPFTLSALRGKVVVLYFGYTNCPAECPLTMAHLKLAVDMLGKKAADVQVVMITTDPARDTPEAMRDFLGKFSGDFVGLVGTPEQLGKVWSDYGVTVDNGGETHSKFLYLIDASGNFRETFLPDSLPADEAADMLLLLGS